MTGLTALVLVELFTSQGCSSCPPADALLERLDQSPPVAVLSEHVDYWNYLGWRDPFSSPALSRRQAAYVRRFGLQGPYTPQMVVDGQHEFVGSDAVQARRLIERAMRSPRTPISLSRNGSKVHAEVSPGARAELWIALAQPGGSADVPRGENAGRQLRHVAIVRSLVKASSVSKERGVSYDLTLPPPEAGASGWRVIAFLQEPDQGKILGVAKL